jgi:hypothetical protein
MTRHTPPEVRQEQLRQCYAISDALTANFLAAMWANKGDTTRAKILSVTDILPTFPKSHPQKTHNNTPKTP